LIVPTKRRQIALCDRGLTLQREYGFWEAAERASRRQEDQTACKKIISPHGERRPLFSCSWREHSGKLVPFTLAMAAFAGQVPIAWLLRASATEGRAGRILRSLGQRSWDCASNCLVGTPPWRHQVVDSVASCGSANIPPSVYKALGCDSEAMPFVRWVQRRHPTIFREITGARAPPAFPPTTCQPRHCLSDVVSRLTTLLPERHMAWQGAGFFVDRAAL